VAFTQALVEAVGWRGATVIFGLIVIGVVVPISTLFMRRSPEDFDLHPDGAESAQAVADAAGAPTRAALLATTRNWTVREALSTPAMWLMLAALTVQGVVLMGTLVYRVDFWQSKGMAPTLVGLGTALDPLCVVFSLLVFGAIADRIQIRYLGVVGVGGMALSMVPLIISDGEPWTILAHNAMWGIAAGGWITLNSVVWPNYFGLLSLGAIRGIVLPVSIAASSAGPPLFGYLLDSGMEPPRLWTLGLVGFALSAVFVLLARPPRAPSEPPELRTPEPVGGTA
jgi:MFS family permease